MATSPVFFLLSVQDGTALGKLHALISGSKTNPCAQLCTCFLYSPFPRDWQIRKVEQSDPFGWMGSSPVHSPLLDSMGVEVVVRLGGRGRAGRTVVVGSSTSMRLSSSSGIEAGVVFRGGRVLLGGGRRVVVGSSSASMISSSSGERVVVRRGGRVRFGGRRVVVGSK